MMKTLKMKCKALYESPQIEVIVLDGEISLALQSDIDGPPTATGEDGDFFGTNCLKTNETDIYV